MPNSGWPRSRNQTRLGQSGGVSCEAEAAELALGIEHDDRGVVVAQVAEVEAEHRRGLARALAADEQRAVLAVVGVDQAGAVARAQDRQQRVGEGPVPARELRRGAVDASCGTRARCGGRSSGRVARGPGRAGRRAGSPAASGCAGRDAADRYALHARGRQREQVRDLGRRDQRARGGQQGRGGGGEAAAVEVLAHDHPAAVQAVLAAARLDARRRAACRSRACRRRRRPRARTGCGSGCARRWPSRPG